jgi:hypothetical protein
MLIENLKGRIHPFAEYNITNNCAPCRHRISGVGINVTGIGVLARWPSNFSGHGWYTHKLFS